jgi:aspartate/methionine/tyrosine aminotransferase
MSLLARARELEAAGHAIVHMEIGEPDFASAEPILAAGMQMLRSGQMHYTPAAGLPALREAIATHYREQHDADVAPEQVFVTPGGSGALLLALALVLDPGRKVILPDPGYPCNRHFVSLLNGIPQPLAVGPESGYQPTVESVRDAWDESCAALMLASPGNPTGTLLGADRLAGLAALCRERRAALIVDEIYHGLTYGEDAASAAGEGAFVVNSFSKYYGMTGWRLGWLVVPPAFVEPAQRLAQNVFIAASTVAQHAALACFSPAAQQVFELRRQAFAQRRDYLLPALRELGFEIPASPAGAFYLYADCSRLWQGDSFELAQLLLEQIGVAITPGRDFGSHRAAQHVRFAYTNKLPQLEEGVRRLGAFFAGRDR